MKKEKKISIVVDINLKECFPAFLHSWKNDLRDLQYALKVGDKIRAQNLTYKLGKDFCGLGLDELASIQDPNYLVKILEEIEVSYL